MSTPAVPFDYPQFLAHLKSQTAEASHRAALAVNRELVLLYWQVGRAILQEQEKAGWGAKVVDELSRDLKIAFPEMKGFSPRNLKYMRAFAAAYPDEAFVQQVAAQIPWFHHCVLMDKVLQPSQREFYIRKTIENGWSRSILVLQIESNLFARLGAAPSNFSRTLPAPQSDLATQILKDPYVFDFLSLGQDSHERDLERALVEHIQSFLLELGQGFAFVGRQYPLEIGGQDYFLDLLFYHLKLRCFVVIDLKMDAFKPEYAGKMNFYLNVVDDLLRHATDHPSIGLLLCKNKNGITVEYALRGLAAPVGVSSFDVEGLSQTHIPIELPSVESLERELESALSNGDSEPNAPVS